MSLNDKSPASLPPAKKSAMSKTDYKEAFENVDSILQTIREALIVLDVDLMVVSANHSFYKTFQTTDKETLGRPIYEIGNGQWNIPELRRRLTEILPQKTTIEDFLVEHDFPWVGRKVMFLNARKVQKSSNEGPDLILLAMEDVTGRKQLEDELKELHEKLEAKVIELENVNEELFQIAYVTSHDLKAPLRAIHNYADFLREDLEEILANEQLEYLNGLTLAVKQGEALIDDLLAFSRIGRSKQSIEEVDLGAVLREMKTTLESTEEVEITIADDWPVIEGEKSLVTQIFSNLLSNAIKFNKSNKKRIELGWKFAERGFVELYVRDNGIGIDSAYHAQIFRIFQRLHNREEFEGTGIGLAIVHKAVKIMAGSILVQSQPGVGSTFFVTLPTRSPRV